MEENKIYTIYKYLAYSLVILSVLLIPIPIQNFSYLDKLGVVIVVNIGFHMCYHLISIVPMKQLSWVSENSRVQQISFVAIKFMSSVIIVVSMLASVSSIVEVISTYDYLIVYRLIVLAGLALGALMLKVKLKSWKSSQSKSI